MKKYINILSLFDGMSCGRVALDRAGIKVANYYASEIDKHAIQVAQKNYPDTIQLGDIRNWRKWDLPNIDLILAGSPCQGFSCAGKHLNFDDPRSKLFFEFVRILKECKPTYFLLENVKMKQEFQDIISEHLGVKPIEINSALFSAQNRRRLYWTNIPNVAQPEDKGIVLQDILEDVGDAFIKNLGEYVPKPDKSQCLDANYHKGVDNHGQRTVVYCVASRGRYTQDGTTTQRMEPRFDGKTNTLTSVQKDNIVGCKLVGEATDINGHDHMKRVYSSAGKHPTLTAICGGNQEKKIAIDDCHYRKLTPVECERLQTLPDNYTAGVSNTQRYKMLGNGWTVDVIVHLLKGLRIEEIPA